MGTRRESKAKPWRLLLRSEIPGASTFIYKTDPPPTADRYSAYAHDGVGIDAGEWRVLTTLYAFSPTTSRQPRLRLHTDKAEVSRARGADARGYASRRIDPKDRRSALIVITPRASAHDAIVLLRQALQRSGSAAHKEVVELHRILDKLMQCVSERIGVGPAASLAATESSRAPRPLLETRRRQHFDALLIHPIVARKSLSNVLGNADLSGY
jgi:DNA-binding MarR family transcriptional regulator